MNPQYLALAVAAACIIWLIPFTSKLGRLYATYLYRKYFFREDIYVTYKVGDVISARYLIRKNADGSITQKKLSDTEVSEMP